MTGPILMDVYLAPGDWQLERPANRSATAAFYDVRACELCGDVRPLRVWALPGFPMSIGGCFQCWYMDCLPLWLVENLEELVGKPAEWVLDMHVFKDGEYVEVRDLP